mgnify:CR=1 FL=1
MGSSIQDIAYTFLQTYYERMKTDPSKLSSLYSHTAELTHINYQQLDSNKSKDDILSTVKLAGKDNIHRFFVRNEKKVSDLKLKLDSCDFQTTGIGHKGIIIMITGDLFWSNSPVFKFCQMFTLVPIGKNSEVYDITNDIIRFIPNESNEVETPSESVTEEVKEPVKKPVKKETTKEEQPIEKEHTKKELTKKEESPVVTDQKIEIVTAPVEESPKETKKSSKHKKEPSTNKESKRSTEPAKPDTPAIKEPHSTSTKKAQVSETATVEKTTTKKEESDDKKKKKSEEKKETETKPKEKKETKTETPEKPKSKHTEKHTKAATPEPVIVNEAVVETTKKVEAIPEVVKESQEETKPEETKETETKNKTEATAAVPNAETSAEPVFTPAPIPAAPKKMSWASKLSQHEGIPKESRKIIVHREEPTPTHNESNNKNKKNNNNNNNRNNKDNNNNNKQNNNSKRRINNNVNRDGYYPVYINGIQNVKPESVKNKVIQEFGPVMKMSTRDNFIVVDFQLESSQKEAIDAKKLTVDGVEVSLERKTYKKGQSNNSSSNSSNSASTSLNSDYRNDSRSPKRFNSNKKPV